MRTDEQIAARIKASTDILGAEQGRLVDAMTYEGAKPLLSADYIAKVESGTEKWERCSTPEELKAAILSYLPFAWEKCNDERGISAGRSVSHFRGLVWLLEDEEALAFLDDDGNYPMYGRPILAYLSDRFGYTGER